MVKITRLILAGLFLGMLAACQTPAGLEINTARGLAPAPPAFNQALYSEYMGVTEFEQVQMQDWDSADLYARKAKSAAAGQRVLPEEVFDYELPPGTEGEISAARERLMSAFEKGGREVRPNDAARAQVMLDCWLEQQEENIQPPHIAACKEGFFAAITRMEPFLAAAEPGPAPMRPAMVVPAAVPAPAMARSFLVFFDWDKANLTPEAMTIVRKAADSAKAMGAAGVNVTGHADRSGPDRYNMGLSMRRAESVKQELVRQGVSGNTVGLSARGERDPLVPTPDGVREPQNRRAEIILR
jgi:OOP family OmpA-OmpF porin